MSNGVEENPGPRVFDPAKTVSADISQGSDVNKHQGSINFNELVDPTHTVCAEFNQGNESLCLDQVQEHSVLPTYILVCEIDLFTIATPS